jgi:hypothetical protein
MCGSRKGESERSCVSMFDETSGAVPRFGIGSWSLPLG